MRNKRKLSIEEEWEIINYYKTHTKRNTGIYFHRDVRTIELILLKHNISLRTHEEELQISKLAAKQTNLKKYGVDNPQKAEIIKNKTKETCLRKYGVTSFLKTDIAQEKNRKAVETRYGVKSFLSLPESKELAKAKMIEKYGVSYAMQDKNLKAKKLATQKENNHMNTSKPEDIFYQKLIEYFGEDDIIRQYKDSRYPFNCDFYIKSKDIFIELNLYYTHQLHAFDPTNENDILQLEYLKNKGWQHVINTWTIRDVLKSNIAIKNNLKYVTYYPKEELSIDKILKLI